VVFAGGRYFHAQEILHELLGSNSFQRFNREHHLTKQIRKCFSLHSITAEMKKSDSRFIPRSILIRNQESGTLKVLSIGGNRERFGRDLESL